MPDQPRMFEIDGYTVDEHRASLGAAGYAKLDDPLPYKARVRIFGEGYVGKVNFLRQSGGKTIRQHVIVVDADTIEFELTGQTIPDETLEPEGDDGDGDGEQADDEVEIDPETEAELNKVFA